MTIAHLQTRALVAPLRQGDLHAHVKQNGGRLKETAAVQLVLKPFMETLSVLHKHGVIHRDIKVRGRAQRRSHRSGGADTVRSLEQCSQGIGGKH